MWGNGWATFYFPVDNSPKMVSLDPCTFVELTSGQGHLLLFPVRELEKTLRIPDFWFCFVFNYTNNTYSS